ncbi:restriction endonuclease [Jiangella asiatica]|uniref:Restriction endonuclease n=1 Tax=Jiangella asiatica TaxID=2530372 RepID=A0A4R5DCK2_9ACTN|nr:restriction endonuclease [Jiangella asiatica]TDE11476.1 restriction endonuclease [Jiangella asiatica]
MPGQPGAENEPRGGPSQGSATPAGGRAQVRAAVQADRERREEYIRQQQAEAADLTSAITARLVELDTVLVEGLNHHGPFSLDQLRHAYRPWPFIPDRALVTPGEAPRWEDYAPRSTAWPARLVTAGRRRATVLARERFERETAAFRGREERRLAALAAAASEHAISEAFRREQILRHNARVDTLRLGVDAREPRAVEGYVGLLLEASTLPDGVPPTVEVAYQPRDRRLLVIRELPDVDIVPSVREYAYNRALDRISAKRRPAKEIQQLYAGLVAQLVLRTIREVFEVRPAGLVAEVAVSGHVTTRNKATGHTERPCLVSVAATRDKFGALVLTELDPRECLRHLDAVVSPDPRELEAVRPIFDPDLSKYRTVEARDAVAVLDGRPVLLELPPTRFEQLIRQLFEAMGMTAWATQSSHDGGVDAVAVNADPIMGGVCVIQVKRYRGVVPVDAVRALAGVMDDTRASRGVLVTTSWFGKASKEFATRHGRIQLIDGGQVKQLLADHLDLQVTVGRLKSR